MHEMEYEMTEGMNHRKVNYYTRNIVHETSHFLLRPQSPKAGKSSRLLSLIPQWVSAAVPTSAGGWVGPIMQDLRVKDLYTSRDNVSSGPEFGSKSSKSLRNIF